ncbi:hypothetical protein EUGRSUZ_G02306 [Eucalyptus grandis]|uniref:Uncharacterized protein n=2 Tax=Eucalyptus grandis TaxID=71139 RepID=A0A059BF89_EUCGR|nr:hypothetical protein EUGRSUZ_G02306 [Eucalyptus grandis]
MPGTPAAAATIPRKRLLVLRKVSSFLRRCARLARTSKRVAVPCLALLRRSAARPGGLERAGDGYRFLQEYEFSPSRTPLIHRYYRKKLKLKLNGRGRRLKEDVRSLLVLCSCLGRGIPSSGWEEEDRFFGAGTFIEPAREALDEEDGGDSVDLRAEMFIRRFYEEMRMQRRLSI